MFVHVVVCDVWCLLLTLSADHLGDPGRKRRRRSLRLSLPPFLVVRRHDLEHLQRQQRQRHCCEELPDPPRLRDARHVVSRGAGT